MKVCRHLNVCILGQIIIIVSNNNSVSIFRQCKNGETVTIHTAQVQFILQYMLKKHIADTQE